MFKFLYIIIFALFFIFTSYPSAGNIYESHLINYYSNKAHTMGISINLYRVRQAEKLEELNDLQSELEKANEFKVDLYKMTGDLCMIFNNTSDPFEDINSIPYKMVFGYDIQKRVGSREIVGFLPSSEVKQVVKWILKNKIDTEIGFYKMYENTSQEVKKELDDWGSPDKSELYNFYVKPLVEFYFAAKKNKNSIVITGE